MKRNGSKSLCPMCGGIKKEGTALYSVDLGFGIVVIRNVPAKVCAQCGEEWIALKTASKLERLVEDARKKRRQIEVIAL